MSIERYKLVHAGEEENRGYEIEGKRGGDPGDSAWPLHFDARGGRRGETLDEEKGGLITLHSSNRNTEDVLVDQCREDVDEQNRTHRGPQPAGGDEDIFQEELMHVPVVATPEIRWGSGDERIVHVVPRHAAEQSPQSGRGSKPGEQREKERGDLAPASLSVPGAGRRGSPRNTGS